MLDKGNQKLGFLHRDGIAPKPSGTTYVLANAKKAHFSYSEVALHV